MLKINDLSLSIGKAQILKNISFDVDKGQIYALVGESGSGKSMTSNAIMRLLPDQAKVDKGDIFFHDHSLLSLSELQMQAVRGRDIAMIFQEPQSALNPVMKIGEQIAEGLRLHFNMNKKQAYNRVIELLKEVDFPDPETRYHWYPHQISGGQKQRVMIAMALACEPKLLIADEPTTALDVTVQRQILNLLKSLRESRGLSILLITHDMGVVYDMADHVGVMYQGALIEEQEAKAFFKNPKEEYSRQLINSLPDMSQFLKSNQDAHSIMNVNDLKVHFPIRKGLLQRTVDHTRAVDGISFELKAGETLAIVGESGSGKTTLGRALLHLTETREGLTQLDGHNTELWLKNDEKGFRQSLQVIFQDPFSSMNPRMTIRDILLEGMESLNVHAQENRESIIAGLMTQVGLSPDMILRYPHEFSGGQRQRIAIARALAVNPKVIICDEPTSALDVSIRAQVLALLKKLQDEQGVSLIFITHDLSLVPHLAHQVMVMKDGQVVEMGNTESVMSAPKHEYTQQLLQAIPRLA